MSNQLEYNLVSGSSYLTENSENPAVDGQIIYDNLVAVATRLFGDEYTDEDMELVITKLGNGTFDGYDEDMDVEAAAQAINESAKRMGGKGWL